MKGIIFSEFLELVEDKFGLNVCQQMLDENDDEGAYTAVGTYDHKHLVKLIISLSKVTGVSIEDLQQVYGKSVFLTLFQSMPGLDGQALTTFDFIRQVESYIHLEVKKLYAEANPPRFKFISSTETEMVMDYISARCFSHVCFGLILGCAEHFNESIDIQMTPILDDGSQVRFTLTKS
ncbi:guanylate cyclase [Aliivibrio fischeri]|uniref:Guanylate cyclase n=1 Tax=Aliivibrio fischeri TaxID=668 RepID=A0A6N3YTX2_ALIFS|nr:nitric oxide sensor HnoX [Aliivibrio fischeri]MUK43849.1 guanylate cyclase [Aliivibrio fischeri]MUK82334.1 guanylate cyclase [Aliivibrio fischeri]MUK83662.1 guanylate cyclase [Aliivibrio fischeri]